MSRSRRHARKRRTRAGGSARIAVSLILGLSVLTASVTYAAYRYDAASARRLLPGVQIGGVDVGEMSRTQAIETLTAHAESSLDTELQVVAGQETWTVTPTELGVTPVIEPAVDRALAVNEQYSWADRVYRRLLDRPVDHSSNLRYRPNPTRIRSFVEGIATEVTVDPRNAQVEVTEGELQLRRPEAGWTLPVKEAERAVRRALASGSGSVDLRLERVEPKITKEDLGYTIVVDISNLELYLYDGVRLQKTYPVAAGSPEYPTPQGEWTIINKRENPTWVNPQPDGWGKSLPPMIGPGPTNPLGTRALDLNAPGIRIHGTSASYSIGSYASHGCVRMLMSDVEELFDIVPVGTAVHIVP